MTRRTLVVALMLLVGGPIVWEMVRPAQSFLSRPSNQAWLGIAAAQTTPQAASPSVLATGRFRAVAHDGAGIATIYQLADGKRVLRLSDFETSNGPDLYVYLVATSDATDSATVKNAGFVSLGRLKGNRGNQNYDLPSDVDLSKYRSVTIWCQRFGVNFTTAPLVH